MVIEEHLFEERYVLKKRIASIIGARPQFIKAALICRETKSESMDGVIIHTGQHYDSNMSDIFFRELRLPEPDYYLGIGSGNHGEQTGRILIDVEKVLLKEHPDMVLVYGDTNSTLAGALAAAKLHIPVAHIESGLRSYNKKMPEEINRIVTDHLSAILFCPTAHAVSNLRKEGFSHIANRGHLIEEYVSFQASPDSPTVINVGDVMFDIAQETISKSDKWQVLSKYGLTEKSFVLVTIHRAENTDVSEKLSILMEAFEVLASQGIPIFFPVHPRTRNALERFALTGRELPGSLKLSEPVSYTEMITLESLASVIITDSGGVQKEGYFFRTPCIIPREETEWVELVEAGWNVVTGVDKERIVSETIRLSRDGVQRPWKNFYGNGDAAKRMVEVLKHAELKPR